MPQKTDTFVICQCGAINSKYYMQKHLQTAKLYSEATARDYLNRLSDLKILEKKTIEGHHYYLNKELHRILSE